MEIRVTASEWDSLAQTTLISRFRPERKTSTNLNFLQPINYPFRKARRFSVAFLTLGLGVTRDHCILPSTTIISSTLHRQILLLLPLILLLLLCILSRHPNLFLPIPHSMKGFKRRIDRHELSLPVC